MELRSMFPNLNGSWVRWSDYRIADIQGVKYIMPSDTATALPYSCTDMPEQMVVDALNLGKLVFEQQEDVQEPCLSFARKYGPLGVTPPVKSPLFDSGRNADNSAKGVAPVYNGIFAKSYGEPLDRYQYALRLLYLYFLKVKGQAANLGKRDEDDLHVQEELLEPCGMNYRLTASAQPQLIWEPDRLLAVLKLSCALLITDAASPLKVCKHCGEAYYNPNSRSEFCSVKCRNCYNVRVFRERKREN